MARALAAEGIEVDIATTDDDGPGRTMADACRTSPGQRDSSRVFFFPKQTEFYKASLPMRTWLHAHVKDYAVVHVHGVFSFASMVAPRAARAARVPFIIRPLGILNSWGMENRRRRIKALSFRLLDKPLLDAAAAIHYTSTAEHLQAMQLGIRAPGHVIPLGIDLSPFDNLSDTRVFYGAFPSARNRDVILFLSRIDKKKGIDLLVDAFALVLKERPGAHLVIAGDGDAAYAAAMRNRATSLGIASGITWAGHLEGEMKLAAFAAAKLFVLPSSSENFGIALLEAMAAGVASVSCSEVALAADSAPAHAVALAERTPQSFSSQTLRLLCDEPARRDLAHAGSALARSEYSLTAMGAKLRKLYENIIS